MDFYYTRLFIVRSVLHCRDCIFVIVVAHQLIHLNNNSPYIFSHHKTCNNINNFFKFIKLKL